MYKYKNNLLSMCMQIISSTRTIPSFKCYIFYAYYGNDSDELGKLFFQIYSDPIQG